MTRNPSSAPLRILLAVLLLAGAAVPLAAGVDRWTPIGPEGGSVLSLASGPGVIYAGTGAGGVFKSTDGGATWAPASAGLPLETINSVAADPANPAIAYAVPDSGTAYRTINGGASWSRIDLDEGVYLLAAAPSEPGTLYAGNILNFFRSTDHGASWTRIEGTPFAPLDLEVDPRDPGTLYVARGPQILRSEDAGATWVTFEPGFAAPGGAADTVYRVAADPRQPSTLYAATLSGQIGKSTDRGATWTAVRPSSLHLQSWALEVDPASGAVYAALRPLIGHTDGEGGIWKSADGGATWSLSRHGLQAYAISQVAPDPQVPGRIFAAALAFGELNTARGVLVRSTDRGESWSAVLGEPETGIGLYLNDLAIHPTEPGTVYVAGRGILRTADGGDTWESRNRGLRAGEYVAALELAPSSPNVLYAIGWGTFPACSGGTCARNVVFRSSDGGAQWRRSRPPLRRFEFLQALAVDAANPSIAYVAGSRFFKTTDGGATWTQAGRGLRGPVLGLLADPFTPGALHAVVLFARRGLPITGIDKSTDGGATWASSDVGFPGWYGVRQLSADPVTPGTLYAATNLGAFLSTNHGATWTVNLKAGLPPGVRVLTLAADPLDPRTLYAGTSGGGGLFVMTRTVP